MWQAAVCFDKRQEEAKHGSIKVPTTLSKPLEDVASCAVDPGCKVAAFNAEHAELEKQHKVTAQPPPAKVKGKVRGGSGESLSPNRNEISAGWQAVPVLGQLPPAPPATTAEPNVLCLSAPGSQHVGEGGWTPPTMSSSS